jgi:hypothetical protein
MSNQLTGNVGLYFACYRLSQLEWNAIPTSRNARGIDIVAYDQHGTCRLFQVKTVSGRNAVPLGKTSDSIKGDFWIIIALERDGHPKSFVMLPSEVRKQAVTDKGGDRASWLPHKAFCDDERFLERWDRIK